ncbi:acetyl-CoA acetyltransferase [candidate division MSBL1 archaeon SCGC-AAA382A20]|uniref:Acetyl-CoA acetyltransferase n=1 Tax=candidate division MSBL1 archaeon SCGC-AAA382A20 TaxID=1698280 RepID=A0A133VJW5_9EURY|nr:acetyl-CoA acetyltransferase [candidate division MSBL1 archaeon SCGC-AAA382A20]
MKEPVIVNGVRTPIGRFGGSLKDIKASKLGSKVIKKVLETAGLKPSISEERRSFGPKKFSDVEKCPVEEEYMNWGDDLKGIELDEVIMGNVLQAGQGQNPARQSSMMAGIPREVPSFTVNKVCASGMKSVALAAEKIEAGNADAVIAGGMECMSHTPYILPKARWGYQMNVAGKGNIVDAMIFDGLYEYFYDYHMGNTAEKLAEVYDISREEQDRLGVESERRAVKAVKDGLFENEIVPVDVSGDGSDIFEEDETPRETRLEALSNLSPVFQKDGSVTAGNASKISDAAAALLVTSREFAEDKDLNIRAALKGYESCSIDPQYMGVGLVPATKKLLHDLDLEISDMDSIELNEAFASQALAVIDELDMPKYGIDITETGGDRINPYGSGISLGHPIGCTGARIIVTQINYLEREGGGLGLSHLCVGGGQGMATVIKV